MRRALAIAAAALLAGSCGGSDPDAGGVRGRAGLGDPVFPLLGNGGYDVVRYTLELRIDPERDMLSAEARIEARASAHLDTFNLDFTGPQINALRVDGVDAPFERAEGELMVDPAALIPGGARFTVEVSYAGRPTFVVPGLIEGWVRRPSVLAAFGLYGGNGTWFPVNETPRDKATYSMAITVPRPHVAVASGVLARTLDEGEQTTFVWEVREPAAPGRGSTFVVAELVQEQLPGSGRIELALHRPPDAPAGLGDAFAVAAEIVDVLSDRFGPYPFETLGIVWAPAAPFDALGGQETVFWSANVLATDQKALAHEIAHQWFGNSATPAESGDQWLSEGFATYAEALWQEHRGGVAARDRLLEFFAAELGRESRPPAVAREVADVGDAAAYFRGALALHSLRLRLGDERFFDLLRAYSREFRYATVTTEDFTGFAEASTGEDLGAFFQAWLHERTVPEIAGES